MRMEVMMRRRDRDEAWKAEVIERAVRRYSTAGKLDRAVTQLQQALAEAFDPLLTAIGRLLGPR
jgi:hypothetical protein